MNTWQHLQPQPQCQARPQPYPYLFRPPHSLDMKEAIRIEIEKERIREEIIMSEIVRRRIEAEVRREPMMMDKDLAPQRRSNGFPTCSYPVMGFDSPLLGIRAEGRSLEERIVLSESLEDGEIETSPFQRGTADLRISEAKPDENISGLERKAVTPPPSGEVNELPSDGGVKKKAKVEWSCGLCQVHVSNECILNEHLWGKKHKAKEAALIADTAGKNCSLGLLAKETTKSIQAIGAVGPGKEASSTNNDLQDNLNSNNLKKNESVAVQKVQKKGSKNECGDINELPSDGGVKKKAKVEWSCGLCQVHVSSERILNEHLWGKKHKAKEAALIADTAGKNCSIGLLAKETTKSIQVVGAVDPGKEASSTSNDLQDNLNSNNLKKNESVAVQKVQKKGSKNESGDVNELPSDGGVKKKAKVEWSCGLCQVHVSNERILNEHLWGKKHKAKEAALIADTAGKNCSIGLLAKETTKSIQVVGAVDPGKEASSTRNDLQDNLNSNNLKKNESVAVQKVQKKGSKNESGDVNELPSDGGVKKKAKVEWSCGLCQVHVSNECILNDHLWGKKHKAKEAALIADTAGKNCSIGLLAKETTKSIQVGGAVDPGKEASSTSNDLQGNLNSNNLKKNESVAVQKVQKKGSEHESGDANELPSDGSVKKKAKVEWSCGLCQVHVSSECNLNEHLWGKKHRAKEAALIADTAEKNCSIGLLAKETAESIQVVGAVDPGKEASSTSNDLQDNLNSNNLKKNESVAVQKVQKNGDLNKNKCEFWCEMCQVGASSEKVMNSHKNGKKHAKRLQQINLNCGTGPSGQQPIKPADQEFVNETKADDQTTKADKLTDDEDYHSCVQEWECQI